MAAFRRAIDDAADGIEIDVRESRCDTLVVVHDPTLIRLAGRPDVVAQCTAKALAQVELILPCGSTRGIPTLDDTIDLCLAAQVELNIEVKGDVPRRIHTTRLLAALLKRRPRSAREHLLVSSFRPEMLAGLRALGAGVRLAFLFDEAHTGSRRAEWLRRVLRPDGVHPEARLASREAIARWKRKGHFVNAWTVDDPAMIARLASDGVSGIITNDPARARRSLGRSTSNGRTEPSA